MHQISMNVYKFCLEIVYDKVGSGDCYLCE